MFWEIYEKHYKKLIIIPVAIQIFFISVLIGHKLTTGEFFSKDISLKGGTSITIYGSKINNVEEWVKDRWGSDSEVIVIRDVFGNFKGYEFRVGQELSIDEVKKALSELLGREVKEGEFSMGLQSASIAKNFFKESLIIIIISLILMGAVVFYYFRSIIPSLSIISSTIADVIVVVGVLNLLNIKLSVASIGALLMIIGYSTDSDVLLATNIIKRKEGSLIERLKRSFKTELTMNMAAITTALIMYFFSNVDLIKSIGLIIFIGSISDMLNTWILSAGLQRWYLEKVKK